MELGLARMHPTQNVPIRSSRTVHLGPLRLEIRSNEPDLEHSRGNSESIRRFYTASAERAQGPVGSDIR